jgi:hypothetical protein
VTVAKVLDFPISVLARWRLRFPDDPDPDPQCAVLCSECGERRAWRGYAGKCGWCRDKAA